MDYGIYKNARNASWQCLIDCGITEVPIKPVKIADHYGIKCKENAARLKTRESGRIIRDEHSGEIMIVVRPDESNQRKRFTIMHELGHYLLGHLGDTPLSRSRNSVRPEEEQVAERFAADILMPACVLWALDIHAAEDIARLCNVSPPAARSRAERMAVLYQRDKFLLHPLERQVFQQFQRFIEQYNK